MGNKILTIWLILLTGWVIFDAWNEHNNVQLRNKKTLYRNEKFDNIDTNFKRLDKRLVSVEEYLSGPLKGNLDQLFKYSHKH